MLENSTLSVLLGSAGLLINFQYRWLPSMMLNGGFMVTRMQFFIICFTAILSLFCFQNVSCSQDGHEDNAAASPKSLGYMRMGANKSNALCWMQGDTNEIYRTKHLLVLDTILFWFFLFFLKIGFFFKKKSMSHLKSSSKNLLNSDLRPAWGKQDVSPVCLCSSPVSTNPWKQCVTLLTNSGQARSDEESEWLLGDMV